MSRLRYIRVKDKYYSAKIRQERNPKPSLKLAGDSYIGDREITKRIQKKIGFSIIAFCLDCYANKLMSCQEIRDVLEREYGYSFSRQWIWIILKHYSVVRSHAESMKVRAITGRMDYARMVQHTDYKHRKIDYNKIIEKRRDGILETTDKIVEFDPYELEKLKKFAKRHKLTISDSIKSLYYPNSPFKTFRARLRMQYR